MTLDAVSRLLQDLNAIEGADDGLDVDCMLRALESILTEERAEKLVNHEEWEYMISSPDTKGLALKRLVEPKTGRDWGTQELAALMEHLEQLHGTHDRRAISLTDRLYLLTLPYRCMWGPEDEPYGRCDAVRDLQIDHIQPVTRGGRGGKNLRWLCGPHNRIKRDKRSPWR